MSDFAQKLARRFARSSQPQPPRYLGTRYDETGTFLSDPGNTIVSHLVPGSATEAVLLEAREKYRAMADAGDFAFTAASSLHMTLFQGILDRRRAQPYWPDDLPLDMPVAETTAEFITRLEGFAPGPRFAVEVVEATPLGLTVDGVTAEDRAALAQWRNRLADVFGYRHPDHESYVFHITFAYPIRWLADERVGAWADMLSEVKESIKAQAPVLELRAPAFCAFQDMNHFEELVVLA